LGLFGSPRKGGNTDILLEEFLRGCEEAGGTCERIRLSRLQVGGCKGCGGCEKTGRCVVEDDMQAVYGALERSGGVVLSAPIYFYNVPAQAKAVIDRAQALWTRKYVLRSEAEAGRRSMPVRRGFFISVGATRGKRLFEGTLQTIRYFYDAIDAEFAGSLLYGQVDDKGAIRRHPTAMRECFEAGLNFVSAWPARPKG
jgi:multimeric flavodoxin WrbA